VDSSVELYGITANFAIDYGMAVDITCGVPVAAACGVSVPSAGGVGLGCGVEVGTPAVV